MSNPRTVLVLEDDPWFRRLLVEVFEREGYVVLQAADGRTGLALARERRPDLVTLDLAMPERSGLDVLHALKGDEATVSMAVVVVSAYSHTMHTTDRRLADAVYSKPLDVDALTVETARLVTAREVPLAG